PFGNLAIPAGQAGPMVLRPTLADGLPLSWNRGNKLLGRNWNVGAAGWPPTGGEAGLCKESTLIDHRHHKRSSCSRECQTERHSFRREFLTRRKRMTVASVERMEASSRRRLSPEGNHTASSDHQ